MYSSRIYVLHRNLSTALVPMLCRYLNTLQHTATHCNTLQHTAYIQMFNIFLCIVVDGYMCSEETMEAAMNTTVGDYLRSTSDMIWKMMTKPRELFWCANAHVHTHTQRLCIQRNPQKTQISGSSTRPGLHDTIPSGKGTCRPARPEPSKE